MLEFTFNGGAFRQYVKTAPVDNRVKEEKKDKTIDIYPNPATNFIVVYNYSTEAGRMIELFDVKGRRVKQQLANGLATRMETSELPAGMYVLRVTAASGTVLRTEKLIINR